MLGHVWDPFSWIYQLGNSDAVDDTGEPHVDNDAISSLKAAFGL